MKLRRAIPADAAVLAKIGRDSFFDAFAADPRNRPEDMRAYMDQAFALETIAAELLEPTTVYLIAELDGAAAGYAKLRLGAREACVTGERPIEVCRLYACHAWIGRGVGPALMEACLDEARRLGHDVIWLGVWEFNPRALRFYEKYGFTRIGEHVFLLGSDPQIDWLFERPTG